MKRTKTIRRMITCNTWNFQTSFLADYRIFQSPLVNIHLGDAVVTLKENLSYKHPCCPMNKLSERQTCKTIVNFYYYTSDSLWKIWLVESIQSIHYTIACELDMINAISAADIAFIMSSSTSAWLLSPLECSPQKQNGWTLLFLRMNYVKNV